MRGKRGRVPESFHWADTVWEAVDGFWVTPLDWAGAGGGDVDGDGGGCGMVMRMMSAMIFRYEWADYGCIDEGFAWIYNWATAASVRPWVYRGMEV